MAKQMIYVRMEDGLSIRRPVEAFQSLLVKNDRCQVLLEDNRKGFVSRNMARKLLKGKPAVLRKRHLNRLLDWIEDTGTQRDERSVL